MIIKIILYNYNKINMYVIIIIPKFHSHLKNTIFSGGIPRCGPGVWSDMAWGSTL